MMKRSSPRNSSTKCAAFRRRTSKHAVEFLELLDADGAGELERPHVVARHDESVGLEERVVVLLALVHDGVGRHVARPAVIADRSREVIDFNVVRDEQPAFHRRDVMGVEGAERVDVAERAAQAAVQAGAQRLAVVLEHDEVVRVAERPDAIQRRRVAENAHRDDHPRARREGGFEMSTRPC